MANDDQMTWSAGLRVRRLSNRIIAFLRENGEDGLVNLLSLMYVAGMIGHEAKVPPQVLHHDLDIALDVASDKTPLDPFEKAQFREAPREEPSWPRERTSDLFLRPVPDPPEPTDEEDT